MSRLLEVSREAIQRLDDKVLRELIARLCRAELYAAGLPLSAVESGGSQDASDGGVDVRVALAADAVGLDFVPRPSTVFQSKASKMPAEKLRRELTAAGTLKPSIREVLEQGGRMSSWPPRKA